MRLDNLIYLNYKRITELERHDIVNNNALRTNPLSSTVKNTSVGKGGVIRMRPKKSASVKSGLRKGLPYLLQAQEQSLNEADTVVRVVKVFEDILGYDALTEVSREAQMRDKYIDVLLKTGDVPRLIVEVKAASVTLRDRHIEQAENYASRNNFRWVLLTNGVAWNLYHLTFEEGIEYEKAFSIDLKKDDFDQAANMMALLHHDFLQVGGLDDYWECQQAMSPASIGRVLFHESVLRNIRREIRRDTGRLIDIEDLAKAVRNMLSPEAREEIGRVRIRKRRRKATTKEGADIKEEAKPCSDSVSSDSGPTVGERIHPSA